ncbi:MAG: hypothetical protein COA73_17775 [Candidatus Hydrogenedentota bacterium]|nr:MAG: hypothetical protein COA73_17775 [Candidatus Hydrogenedentota bacterium]
MKSILAWSGWGVSVVLVIAGVLRMEQLADEHALEVQQLKDQMVALDHSASDESIAQDMTPIARERDDLLEQVATLELALATKNEIEVIGEKAEAEKGNTKDSDKPARNEAQQQMMEVQASAITELLYADLFMELGLDGDVEDSVTAALVDRMLDQMDVGQAALKAGDVTAREVYLAQEAARAETYAALREVLDREAMDAFEAYDANRDALLLEKTVAPQIAQLSSGLTEENRTLVERVATEELGHYQNVFNQSDTLFTMAENANWQIEAMESMQSRLSEVLDEQQMGEVNRWLDLGLRQMEAMKKR